MVFDVRAVMATSSAVEYTIGGVKINFPCKAYPSQLAMMNSVSVHTILTINMTYRAFNYLIIELSCVKGEIEVSPQISFQNLFEFYHLVIVL